MKKCEYCSHKGIESLIEFELEIGGNLDVVIVGNKIQIYTHNGSLEVDEEFKINYCPVCGRKLNLNKEEILEGLKEIKFRKSKRNYLDSDEVLIINSAIELLSEREDDNND